MARKSVEKISNIGLRETVIRSLVGLTLVSGLVFSAASIILSGCGTTGLIGSGVDDAAIDKLPGDRLIIPGQRVGPIFLGQSMDNVTKILGPSDSDGSRIINKDLPGRVDAHWYRWARYGLTMNCYEYDAYAKVIAIWVSSPKWKTDNGLNISTPYNEALEKIAPRNDIYSYPICNNSECHAEDIRGMMLRAVTRTGPLNQLSIYDPSDNKSSAAGIF